MTLYCCSEADAKEAGTSHCDIRFQVCIFWQNGLDAVSNKISQGLAFGADATILPIMCGTVSKPHQGTLYAVGKVLGLLASNLWIWFAAQEAQHSE